jgi:hypothetical protein
MVARVVFVRHRQYTTIVITIQPPTTSNRCSNDSCSITLIIILINIKVP